MDCQETWHKESTAPYLSAYPSIPARHDLWRRVISDWLAGLVVRGIVNEEEAQAMIHDMAYGLARQTYKLDA